MITLPRFRLRSEGSNSAPLYETCRAKYHPGEVCVRGGRKETFLIVSDLGLRPSLSRKRSNSLQVLSLKDHATVCLAVSSSHFGRVELFLMECRNKLSLDMTEDHFSMMIHTTLIRLKNIWEKISLRMATMGKKQN